METKVNKMDYEIHSFKFNAPAYYAISLKGSFGGTAVWGGDSADIDCHNRELAEQIMLQWDGSLVDGTIGL